MSTNDASTSPETSDSPAEPAVDTPAQTEEVTSAAATPESSEEEPEATPASPEDKPEPQPETASETPSAPEEAPEPTQEVADVTKKDVKDDSSPEPLEASESAAPEEESSQETAQDPEPQLQQKPDQESAQEPVITALPQEKAPESVPEPPKTYTKKDYAEHYRATVEVLLASPDHPLNRKRPLTFPLWPKHRRWAYEDKIDDEAMIFQRRIFAERSTPEQARFALTKGKARGWEVADRWTTFAEHEDPAIRELYQEVFPRDAKKYERWKKFMAREGRPF